MGFEKHCWAEIDLDALCRNVALVRQTVGGPVCGVVKADAYGHGDLAVARALRQAGVAALAVSCLAEARHLRAGGIGGPLLILGYTAPEQAAALAALDVATAVFSSEYAAALSAAAVAAGCTVPVHLKVDTGMGRIGFAACTGFEDTVRRMEACYALPGLRVQGVFQHFSVADSDAPADLAYTEGQYALFARLVGRLRADGFAPGTVHCANSAAQMRHPEWRQDMTRAGIILYGLDPSPQVHFPGLCPVMALKAVVTFVKQLQPGQCVSYGRTYTAAAPRLAATVSVGYADGYPRLLSGGQGGGVMLVRGRPAPVLGRVCMDQTVIDVTGIPGVAMGDEVTVFGPAAGPLGADTADTIAAKAGTINYEITCGIARRVPRVYLQGGAPVQIWNDLEER